METQLEVERKFAVSDEFELRRVVLPDAVEMVADRELELDSTYVDAPDLRLAAHGITLRRRTGGHDDGWHLKLPLGEDRQEFREPPGRSGTKPPKSLRDLVRVHVRSNTLQPVVRITTTRRVHHIRDRHATDHRILAELVDDRVTAHVSGDEPATSTWREIEVELVDGEPPVLDHMSDALLAAGAAPSAATSKLARALGDRRPQRNGRARPIGKRATAADVVMAYVSDQIAALKNADPGVRTDAPDAVHQMRVACRRLRSALKTFGPVLDRGHTDHVRDELKWIATALGDARDAEVMHARLRHEAEADPGSADREVALARIDHDLDSRYAKAHRGALRALDSPRYFSLLDDLDRMVDEPPLTSRATGPAGRDLPRLARKAFRAVRRRHDAAEAAPTPEEREKGLHEVRKAAKRARYAGEALQPAFGKDAKRFAAAMERIQEILGDHHDGVVTQQTLIGMAAQAHTAGENTFELGRLAGREGARVVRAEDEYRRAWTAASKKKLRRWTR